MTNEAALEVVEELARSMDMSELLEEYNQIADDRVEKTVENVIMERRSCPECENEMIMDESDGVLYCPVDGTEYGT